MKFGLRTPSLRRRLAARTSWKRYVRHSLGLNAPRGWGWVTNPKRALHGRVYNRTTLSVDQLGWVVLVLLVLGAVGACLRSLSGPAPSTLKAAYRAVRGGDGSWMRVVRKVAVAGLMLLIWQYHDALNEL